MRLTAILPRCVMIFALFSTGALASTLIEEDVQAFVSSTSASKASYASGVFGGLGAPVTKAVSLVNRVINFSLAHPKLAGATALLLVGQLGSVAAMSWCYCYCRTFLPTCTLDVYLRPSLKLFDCSIACAQIEGIAAGCFNSLVPESHWLSYGLRRNCSEFL